MPSFIKGNRVTPNVDQIFKQDAYTTQMTAHDNNDNEYLTKLSGGFDL